MTAGSLAKAYLEKAKLRMDVLTLLFERRGFSDVVREAQELVELATKAMLRQVGVEPPKWHDVGALLLDAAHRFPEGVREQLPRVAEISRALRKEREFSFYGDEDFIPTEQYGPEDAQGAIEAARFVLSAAQKVVE